MPRSDQSFHHPVIIGAGPAGLMAAQILGQAGFPAQIYDAMPSPARKFLRAGIGGLNLTHGEELERFIRRFGANADRFAPWLRQFGPSQVRQWAADLGVQTFVGSSGRVFPIGMKASPLLRSWLHHLHDLGCRLHSRHRWQGWNDRGELMFDHGGETVTVQASAVILALGGASWPQLGSDGGWTALFGGQTVPFQPSNCGFDCEWSDHFRDRWAGQPVKSIGLDHRALNLTHDALASIDAPRRLLLERAAKQTNGLRTASGIRDLALNLTHDGPASIDAPRRLRLERAAKQTDGLRTASGIKDPSCGTQSVRGEFMLTRNGIEGGSIYALSAPLRDTIAAQGSADLWVDLKPDWDMARLTAALARPRGSRSLSHHLERTANLKGTHAALLRECLGPGMGQASAADLASAIKALPLRLLRPRPLAEAISSAGGLHWDALSDDLMLISRPGTFASGEMLDWEAPTGGYLLTGCFSTATVAAQAAIRWIRDQ